MIDVTVPIIEGIKADKCLMNTSIVDLNNVVGKQLGSSMNVVIEGFQNYITAIKDKKKDEGNTNIDNAKNVLDARINGYETNTVPNAKTQMDNKCQNDNNESNCIRNARKEFNLNGRKPVKLKPEPNCFIYRGGDSKNIKTFAPKLGRDENSHGIKIGLSATGLLANSPINGKHQKISIPVLYGQNDGLYAFFDDINTAHISIRPDGDISYIKNKMTEWGIDYDLVDRWIQENRIVGQPIPWPKWWENKTFYIYNKELYHFWDSTLRNASVLEVKK